MADVITYETLYELLRKEKYSPSLQELDKEFFKNVITYLEEKEKLISNSPKESAFSKEISNARKQVENAKKLIKEFYERRENKLIQMALLSSRSGNREDFNLLQEESKFYQELHAVLSRYRKDILENILNNQQPVVKEQPIEAPKTIKTDNSEAENKLVRFVHSTPQFMAPDLKVYGPFEKEDIGFVPQKVANTLIKKNRAEEIKSEEK
jgi:DNA replication initiation complex subunit (GINS family)